jgi:hypothetical protein
MRLKLSGKRSNPLEGEVRVKKRSGPPNANTRDWDSNDVGEETIDFADSIVKLYETAIWGMEGISSLYLSLKAQKVKRETKQKVKRK